MTTTVPPKFDAVPPALDWLVTEDRDNKVFNIDTGDFMEPYWSRCCQKYYARSRLMGDEIKDEEIVAMLNEVVVLYYAIKEGRDDGHSVDGDISGATPDSEDAVGEKGSTDDPA